jgi:hypothetical protein
LPNTFPKQLSCLWSCFPKKNSFTSGAELYQTCLIY